MIYMMMIYKPGQVISLLTLLTLLISFAACSTTQESAAAEEAAASESSAETADPAHNARNALGYYGSYEGMLPCASCEGIEIRLTLYPQRQYHMETVYTGRSEEVIVNEGQFSWNEAGNTITLEGIESEERAAQFFVAENRLMQLDSDGERITGDLADAYTLEKKGDLRYSRNIPLPHEERYVPTALEGQEIQQPDEMNQQPDIYFNTEEKRVYGSAGCNRYNATYEAPGDGELQLSHIAATKMMCENMALEERYLNLLQQVRAYEYDPHIRQILLMNEEGIIIARFQHESTL